MRGWRRTLLLALAWVAAHEAATRVCERVGLVERMLSPGGGGVALVVAALATVALFALRVGVIFVLPGWLMARVIVGWRARRGGGAADDEPRRSPSLTAG